MHTVMSNEKLHKLLANKLDGYNFFMHEGIMKSFENAYKIDSRYVWNLRNTILRLYEVGCIHQNFNVRLEKRRERSAIRIESHCAHKHNHFFYLILVAMSSSLFSVFFCAKTQKLTLAKQSTNWFVKIKVLDKKK